MKRINKIKVSLFVFSAGIFLFESFFLDTNFSVPVRIGLFLFLLLLNGVITVLLSLLVSFTSKIFLKKTIDFTFIFLVIFALLSLITIRGWYSLQTDEQLNRKLEKAPFVEDFWNAS